MRTDIQPIVQRLLQRLVLAGVPILMAACSDSGGMTGTGGKPSTTGGSGGWATGGAGSGGRGGGGGGTGGAGVQDAGTDAGQACHPLALECGVVPSCSGFGGADAGPPTPLPLTTATVTFDVNDPRWAQLYRACVATEGAAGCGTGCRGLCMAATQAAGAATYDSYSKCDVTCGSPDKITVSYTNSVCGRRPSRGFGRRCLDQSETPLGRLLAQAAELEAASVPAFRRVVDELRAHEAPPALVRAARAAMADEARHWRRTRDVARRHGGRPVRPAVTDTPLGSLEEIALDNVVEGCVRETYGALVALHQASSATDPDIRKLMSEIAEDEASHAALAWRIDTWTSAKLPTEYQQRRNQTARAALRELLAAATELIEEPLRVRAGLPSPTEAHELLGTTYTRLWNQAFSTLPCSASRQADTRA